MKAIACIGITGQTCLVALRREVPEGRRADQTMPNHPVSAAARRIVQLLAGRPPVSITELINATGVTRTAITEQLNELVAAGFVERSTERCSSRGRPKHLYRATPQALKLLFASNHSVLVPAIHRAVLDVGGKELVDRVSRRVSVYLSEALRSRIKSDTPRSRFEELYRVLEQEGVLVDLIDYGDRIILKKRTCPFISMHDDSDFMCLVDCQVISEVVGCRVIQTESRHDGDPCCAFELPLSPASTGLDESPNA